MLKSYTGRYPIIEDKQVSFVRAITSMLNCRRYLTEQKFEEVLNPKFSEYYQSISINGKIIFPDKSTLNEEALHSVKNTATRDKIFEKIIIQTAKFEKPPFFLGDRYERSKIVMTTFRQKGYTCNLRVRDTTREKRIFPINLFSYDPKLFAFEYRLNLEKDVVSDEDISDFENHKKSLEVMAREESIKNLHKFDDDEALSEEIEKSLRETDFVNPWDIKIPKIGGSK